MNIYDIKSSTGGISRNNETAIFIDPSARSRLGSLSPDLRILEMDRFHQQEWHVP